MFARLRSLVRALTSRRDFEAGLTEELRFHIEQYTEDLVRSGVSPEEARRRARMELGGINTVKEECREARGLGWIRCAGTGVPLCRPSVMAQPRLRRYRRPDPCACYRGKHRNLFAGECAPAERFAIRASRAHRDPLCSEHQALNPLIREGPSMVSNGSGCATTCPRCSPLCPR